MPYNRGMARTPLIIGRPARPPLAPLHAGGGRRSPGCRSRHKHLFGHTCRVKLARCHRKYAAACRPAPEVAYDAYGNNLGFDAATALTTLLYSGEQFDQRIAMQYLRARYYAPTIGRFNQLDPFFGKLEDPQSLHKYLYVHGNPIVLVGPTGERAMVNVMAALGVVGLLAAGMFVVPGLWGRFGASWGLREARESQEIAIVVGDLGFLNNAALSNSAVSIQRFRYELEKVGHVVTYSKNPTEEAMIQLLNDNDMVIVLGHGPPDSFDENELPLAGIRLGGNSVHDDENAVRLAQYGLPSAATSPLNPAWITANELEGTINNRDLVFVVPGCNGGRTDRLYRATGARLFVGCTTETNATNVVDVLQWVVDYLNEGEQTANKRFLDKSKVNVINPDNPKFF